ncbi:MAG: spondin domain-containing protein [Flavobacteriaceae bacterium]|nr:spondin domain-containing protein [Flavobacteriaceae bacterium]
MKNLILIALIVCVSTWTIQAQNSTATYSVAFDSNWSQSSHPHPSGNIPSNAHWSKLVGATHNDQVTFFEMGGISSPGIENVAELGSNSMFFSEVNSAISDGTTYALIDGPGLSSGLGSIVIDEVITTNDYPLISLVSMIAPSPDWIVAINSISLLDNDENWIDTISIDLYPYDAGTDSGTDYTSSNIDTTPKEPISSLQGTFPFSSEKMGTLRITLEEVILGINDSDINESISMYPNPAQDYITISHNTALSSVEFYSVLGTKVFEKSNLHSLSETFDISHLPSGIYLINSVDTDKNSSTKKLVIR